LKRSNFKFLENNSPKPLDKLKYICYTVFNGRNNTKLMYVLVKEREVSYGWIQG
jgi:hypothetical protein